MCKLKISIFAATLGVALVISALAPWTPESCWRLWQFGSGWRAISSSAKGQTRTFRAPLQKGGEWNSASSNAYLEVASGSIPLFLIASEACAEARNSTSRLESSASRSAERPLP